MISNNVAYAAVPAVEKEEEHPFLFVYGSARKGSYNHDRLIPRGSRFMGFGWADGRLYDLGAYPAAILDKHDKGGIAGEVYELPSLDALTFMDAIERGAGYERVRTVAAVETGAHLLNMSVWIYEYKRRVLSPAELIPGGDWMKRGGK